MSEQTYRVVLTRTITETVVIDDVPAEMVDEKPKASTKITDYLSYPNFIEHNKLTVARSVGDWKISEKARN